MPGRGALARKEERKRAQKEEANQIALEKGEEPPFKIARGEDALEENVWVKTPPLHELSEEERDVHVELIHQIFLVLQQYDDCRLTVQQLRQDKRIGDFLNQRCFVGQRFYHILQRSPECFCVEPEVSGKIVGQLKVSLAPDAEDNLPENWKLEDFKDALDLSALPPRILHPAGDAEKAQGCRIDVIHAMHRLGCTVLIQDLGQDPRLIAHKKDFLSSRSLLDLMKAFPQNFAVDASELNIITAELISYDVSDTATIDEFLEASKKKKAPAQKDKVEAPWQTSGKVKGGIVPPWQAQGAKAYGKGHHHVKGAGFSHPMTNFMQGAMGNPCMAMAMAHAWASIAQEAASKGGWGKSGGKQYGNGKGKAKGKHAW